MPHDHNWHVVLYLSVTDRGPCHMIKDMLYSICQSQMEVHTTWLLTCCTLFVSHRWRFMPHDHWHAVLYLSVTDGGPCHMIIDMLYSIYQSQMEVHATWSLTCCTLFVSHRWRSMPHDHWHVVLYLSVTDGGPCHMIIDMLYSICQSQMEVHATWPMTCCTLFVSHRWRSIPHDHNWHVVLYVWVTDGGPYHMIIIYMLYSICQSQMEVPTTWSDLTCCSLFVSHRWRSIPQDHWHVVLNLSVTDGGPCHMIEIDMLYSIWQSR